MRLAGEVDGFLTGVLDEVVIGETGRSGDRWE